MMSRWSATLALALCPLGCSEYNFGEKVQVDPPIETGVTDTGEPPLPATCPSEPPPFGDAPLTAPCALAPVIGTFQPTVKWHWQDNPIHAGYSQIMASPAVLNLTDDNGDGRIDASDIPDVVFTAFAVGVSYTGPGALTAISGADGATLWSVRDVAGYQPAASSGVALGDLDADGLPEVVVSSTSGLLALTHTGDFKWHAPVAVSSYGMPAIADIDNDGRAEVIFGRTVVNHDGVIRWTGTGGFGVAGRVSSFATDVDNDGLAEIIAGNTLYGHDGSLRWQDGTDGSAAVADLDLDGSPEIINVPGGEITARRVDGTLMWSFALTDGGGGPPTIADYDGDGFPEIGVASREFYWVIEHDGTLKWKNPVQDFSSSRTGSAVFDFEGDGASEVVYADEETLWVYDGTTGAVELAYTDHSSGTLYEYPLVVDVDNDGSAEIVLASNDYTFAGSRGITVIGDANDSWAPARRVWNQHAYAIENIDENGAVPRRPRQSWRTFNSFRAGNSETRSGSAAPDLAVGAPAVCTDVCSEGYAVVWVPVHSVGEVPPDRTTLLELVRLEAAGETPLRSVQVPVVPVGDTFVAGPLNISASDIGPRGLAFRAGVSASTQWTLTECDTTNNAHVLSTYPCDAP